MFKLFIYESCPYCLKVRAAMSDLKLEDGKDFVLVDAHSKNGSSELVKLGGKQQVPFIIDGDIKMYESDDIIKYLREKFI